MSLEEQIKNYKEISRAIEALEEQKKALGAAIFAKMAGNMCQTNEYVVRKVERLSYSVSIEDARMYQATKMEETVDKDKIKALYQSGHPIPGVKEIKYIQVTEKKPSPVYSNQ